MCFAGPMIAPVHGDTRIMDRPEEWICGNLTQDEIIGYRMNLVRGKRMTNAGDLGNRFVEKLQEIVLAKVRSRARLHLKARRPVFHFQKSIPHLGRVPRWNGSRSRQSAGIHPLKRSFMILT